MTTKYILTFQDEHNGIKEAFDTAKEANEKASYYWNHLTKNEKKKNQIYIEKIDETCLTREAIDEQGYIKDWTQNEDALYTNEELFDSEKYTN